MLRTALRTGSILALFAALAGLAPAQETAPVRRAPATSVRAKSLIGAKVNIQGGTSVGTVEDVVLSNEGVIDYVIVSQGGKMLTVPWDVAKFDYEKRSVMVPITQEQYQKIPTYTSERYPNYYTPEYRTQLYKYYGVTPGAERRLERRLDRRP